MKFISNDEVLKILLDYVNDDRIKQAILINGPWGCGKSHFINHVFCEKIKSQEDIAVIKVSLYGKSSHEEIQNDIDNQIRMILVERSAKKAAGSIGTEVHIGGTLKSALYRACSLLYKNEQVKGIADNVLGLIEESSNIKWLLIFDDFERANLAPVPLMGILNNYVENAGYRVILVADEENAFYAANNNDSNLPEKYSVALSDLIDYENGKNNGNKAEGKISIGTLRDRTDQLFDNQELYKRTKEKLIFRTINYSADFELSYEAIVQSNVKNDAVKEFMLSNKYEIVREFISFDCHNLRTLISVCITADEIMGIFEDAAESVDDRNEEIEEIIRDSKQKALVQIITETVCQSLGSSPGIFENSSDRYRYFNIKKLTGTKLIICFRFIDEYIFYGTLNCEEATQDVRNYIEEKIKENRNAKEEDSHKELSFFKLAKWYFLKDNEVESLVQQMKTELKNKDYYPSEFKDIVLKLMQINNEEFGMHPERSVDSHGYIIRSVRCDDSGEVKSDGSCLPVEGTEKFPISGFVELMSSYFDESEKLTTDGNITRDIQNKRIITKEQLRVISEDGEYVKKYRTLMEPLYQIAETQEKKIFENKIKFEANSEKIKFDDDFVKHTLDNKQDCLNRGAFLSAFDNEQLLVSLLSASGEELSNFQECLRIMYGSSNSLDFFAQDKSILNEICDTLKNRMGNSEINRSEKIFLTQVIYQIGKILGLNDVV